MLPGFSQTQPVPTSTNQLSSNRYLVILDISSGMEKRAGNAQRVLSQLFASGLNGELRRGDTIGVWTYDHDLHTGEFPLQRWSAQSGREITTAMLQFFQKQRYGKPSRWSPVMGRLKAIMEDSNKITVLLMSDGSAPPTGTPFDTQISKAFEANAEEQKRQAMPFVTVLRAIKGEFVGFKVSTPPWPIELPAFPPESMATTTELTNPPPTNILTPTPVPLAGALELQHTNLETNIPTATITNSPIVVQSKPTAPEPPTNSPQATLTNSRPPATNIAKRLPAPTNTANARTSATNSAVSKSASSPGTIPLLMGAIALVGLAIVSLAILRRARQPTRVSLITRSMNKDRK